MRMVLLLAAAAAAAPPPSSVPPERVAQPSGMGFVTALDGDCTHGGRASGGGYQFVGGCAAASRSPDGRFAVRQERPRAADTDGVGGEITLTDVKGRVLDTIDALRDDMPYVVFWAPRGDWFFVNHYLGSGQDRLRLFEVVNGTVVERSDIYADVIRAMVERYPCLSRHASVVASGWRWSRDGRRILLVAYSRPDACALEPGEKGPAGDWEALWMIGDIGTGRVQRDTIRVRGHAEPLPAPPHDGPYADF